MVSKMRFSFGHLLLVLLILFGCLYLYENGYKELWANLFAALIAVLLVDRIVEKSRLQKSERSIRYVKGYIAEVCGDLISQMSPPIRWQERLEKGAPNLDDYYSTISASRANALNRLETLFDRHSHLMDAELRNDVFDIIDLLRDSFWDFARERDPMRLQYVASQAAAVINESLEAIKRHKLLEGTGRSKFWEKGRPPIIEIGTLDISGIQILEYEKWLKESIEFRDECQRRDIAKKKEFE
jgi:hypothetical protein